MESRTTSTLTLDVWAPERGDDKFLLFQATPFVVIRSATPIGTLECLQGRLHVFHQRAERGREPEPVAVSEWGPAGPAAPRTREAPASPASRQRAPSARSAPGTCRHLLGSQRAPCSPSTLPTLSARDYTRDEPQVPPSPSKVVSPNLICWLTCSERRDGCQCHATHHMLCPERPRHLIQSRC